MDGGEFMIGLLFYLVVLVCSILIYLALYSLLGCLKLVNGFLTDVRLMDSVFFGTTIGVCLIFKKELPEINELIPFDIPIIISLALTLTIGIIAYKISKTKVGFFIFAILTSPTWAIVCSFISSVFTDDKKVFWIVFASITISSLIIHFKQKDSIPETVLSFQ